jgi:hypothetical protein
VVGLMSGLCVARKTLSDVDWEDLVGDMRGAIQRHVACSTIASREVMLSRGVLARARTGDWSVDDARGQHILQVVSGTRMPNSLYSVVVSDGETQAVMTTTTSDARVVVHRPMEQGAEDRAVPIIAKVSFVVSRIGPFAVFRATKVQDMHVPAAAARSLIGNPTPPDAQLNEKEVLSFQTMALTHSPLSGHKSPGSRASDPSCCGHKCRQVFFLLIPTLYSTSRMPSGTFCSLHARHRPSTQRARYAHYPTSAPLRCILSAQENVPIHSQLLMFSRARTTKVFEDDERQHLLGDAGDSPRCVLLDFPLPDFEDVIPDMYKPVGGGARNFTMAMRRWCLYFHGVHQVWSVSGRGRRAILPPCYILAIRRKYPEPAGSSYTDHVYSTTYIDDDAAAASSDDGEADGALDGSAPTEQDESDDERERLNGDAQRGMFELDSQATAVHDSAREARAAVRRADAEELVALLTPQPSIAVSDSEESACDMEEGDYDSVEDDDDDGDDETGDDEDDTENGNDDERSACAASCTSISGSGCRCASSGQDEVSKSLNF